jgi:hypothetical protein
MPAVWGPAHGYWVCILFYPLWIFADNCIYSAWSTGHILAIILAVLVLLGTAAFTIFFARTAGPGAYARVANKVPIDAYLKRERIWAVASAVIAIVFLAVATWFNLAIR